MKYRVIQWATGGVGRAAIEGIAAHPELELVGCWVHDPAKEGRDAGELAGITPTGVRATRDESAILALSADCVVYCPLFAQTAEVERILRSGKNVVTPLGWFFPAPGAGVAKIEAACRDAGVTFVRRRVEAELELQAVKVVGHDDEALLREPRAHRMNAVDIGHQLAKLIELSVGAVDARVALVRDVLGRR